MCPKMLLKFADNGNPNSWASRLRRKRTKRLLDMLPSGKQIRILDVGGTAHFWMNLYGNAIPEHIAITVLNLIYEPSEHPQIKALAGDARDLSCFQSEEFDICFSNSVIE